MDSLTSGIFGNPSPQLAVYTGIAGNSVLPASGYYGTSWPARSGGVIPQGVSAGGWTLDPDNNSKGYPQQTFLGASIRNFSMNGGFGDSSSTLSVELVVDEFNNSDETGLGQGDDPYHSGKGDRFIPPMAGSPVFFKFGGNFATVEEAYRLTFDSIYRTNTLSAWTSFGGDDSYDKDNFKSLDDNQYVNLATNQIFTADVTSAGRGSGHIVFGGILQSYLQNRGPGGNPLYSVQVTDPREILSNVTLILNNYAGNTYGVKNVLNIYGFLEHNMTADLFSELTSYFGSNKNILTKSVNPDGTVSYAGSMGNDKPLDCWFKSINNGFESFPITGTGFSRRGSQGIPYYRVAQAITALLSYSYSLPNEYKIRGLGGVINFRGYNYVVDFGGLPTLPPMYYLDFDQINMLDLALEICDVASRDLFVSLLPVINHPACSFIYNQNVSYAGQYSKLIHGIIRLDSVDRSGPPIYGAIKNYIDNLSARGIKVENQDVGYELSNVTTDKFVVGANEVDMYFFSSNADRDTLSVRSSRSGGDGTTDSGLQWDLKPQLEQQILPYYGLLGNNAITIPKGWGAYQQILLDTTGLNANGVGSYYVTTEMELRCASVSYDCWKDFLKQYNDVYMESIEGNDTIEGGALRQKIDFGGVPHAPNISNNYAVTVPRSVFRSYAPYSEAPGWSRQGIPLSPCNPPYGYPLYYKRMTRLGIPEGGLVQLQSRITSMINGSATLKNLGADQYEEVINSQLRELEEISEQYATLTPAEKNYYAAISGALQQTPPKIDLLNDIEDSLHKIGAVLPRLAKKGTENALKVYNFLKKIADENLGKKFLVRIPNKVNLAYTAGVTQSNGQYISGPFGFQPRPLSGDINYQFSSTFINTAAGARNSLNIMKSFLSSGVDNSYNYLGALRANFNPISDKFEFNYTPSNIGGYFPFDLYSNTLPYDQIGSLELVNRPSGVTNLLIPQDLTNFLDENGRISPYVRFDHSQYLSLSSFGAEEFTQQIITPQGMIPDLCEFLDNVGEDDISFSDADSERPDRFGYPPCCAFVKCNVDEKFYMPPMTSGQIFDVYGAVEVSPKVSKPRKIFIPCSGLKDGVLVDGTGVYVDSIRYTESSYKPTWDKVDAVNRLDFSSEYSVSLNSEIIKTKLQDLDTRFVYALITLSNKVIPTKDLRYRDSINQKSNAYQVKHYLTADVVKNLPEFNTPGYNKRANETNIIGSDRYRFTAEQLSVAWLASQKAKSALQFGFPQQIKMVAPSPVYPDLVAIPLMSNERCYGPWLSSQVDPQSNAYVNVGGRTEFIKDENLSPWNYAGYELLNQAGVLQAQFANSLLLFSERGGFTFPGAPDRSLLQALAAGGPLVTNIAVDVSENGIRTTYKLDLYTASFGKLQKQKQDMISKISREKQKLRDERNALIRKGLGKMQTSSNMIGNINLFANDGTPINNSRPTTHIVSSLSRYETQSYSSTVGGAVNENTNVYFSSMQSEEDIIDCMNNFDGLQRHLAEYNTGAADLNDMYLPYSADPYHSNLPNIKNTNRSKDLYSNEDFIIDENGITTA